MRGGESGDRRGECQVAGAHRTGPAGAPLCHKTGPDRVPVGAAVLQAARAAGGTGQDEGADDTCRLHHAGIEMGGPGLDQPGGVGRVGSVHRDVVARGEDHQRQARLTVPGRPRPAPAWRGVRCRPAHGPAGGLGPPFADGLRGQPAGRHVPRLHTADVPYVDLADPGRCQQTGHLGTHPSRAPHLNPLYAAGRQAGDRLAWPGGGQRQRRQVGQQPFEGVLPGTQRLARGTSSRGVVEQSRPLQTLDQLVDLRAGQVHAAPLLAQQAESAGAVEQAEETSRGRVHRPQCQCVRRGHPELHGVEVAPAAPQRGLHQRMHDRPP